MPPGGARQPTIHVECLLLLLGCIGCLALLVELSATLSRPAAASLAVSQHGQHVEHESEGHAEHSEEHAEHWDGAHHTQGQGGPAPFCSGMPMVMGNMQGFSREACVVLFFAAWDITSAGRMGLAAAGVLLLSLTYEWLKSVERRLYAAAPYLQAEPHCNNAALDEGRAVRALLHGVILSMGYLCMFVAMTFSPLLFLTQVLGFSAGHYLWGPTPGELSVGAASSGDPCCD